MKSADEYKFSFALFGAGETDNCSGDVLDIAKHLGKEITEHGHIVNVSQLKGFPLWAAIGAKQMEGHVTVFSPAVGSREHADVYNMQSDYADQMVYTGFGITGANLIMTRSSDAVIVGCGDLGTLHDYVIALNEHKPIGILEGPWDTDEMIRGMQEKFNIDEGMVIFDSDPKRLIEQLIKKVKDIHK